MPPGMVVLAVALALLCLLVVVIGFGLLGEACLVRSMKRKDRRQEKHFAARSDRLKEVNEEGENKENEDDDVESKKAKTKQETRRQKLNDYLEQKKKLEDMKRKLAKPAFKVGIVHHSLAPKFTDDSDSYNVFSTTMPNNTPAHMK